MIFTNFLNLSNQFVKKKMILLNMADKYHLPWTKFSLEIFMNVYKRKTPGNNFLV